MQNNLKAIFSQLAVGHDLTRGQSRWVFERIMSGQLGEGAIGALLGGLLAKGETVDELVGAAEAMRASAVPVTCAVECIDTCGTGGDGVSTFNVSTTAAIIAAAAGATVAKHGNCSTTRVSGSTDVLTHLGIDTDASVPTVERCLKDVRIGYLNARNLHPAMGHVAPVRQAIPHRTIFNLLGPLTNPAGVTRQVLGVPKLRFVEKMAETLRRMHVVHAWVVHGDGLCDLTVTGTSTVMEVREGSLTRLEISPESVRLRRGALDDLLVDSPAASAAMIIAILQGQPGAPRDHALLNAGAALVVAGQAGSLGEGVAKAAGVLDSGLAMDTLARWRAIAPAAVEAGGGGKTS